MLDILVSLCAGDQTYACYIRGLVVGKKELLGVCSCGVNHEEEAEAALTPTKSAMVERQFDFDPNYIEGVDTEYPAMVELDSEANLEKYSLETVSAYQDGDPHPTGLRCKECNQMYPSVEDRMMRPPGVEGCGGCQIKSAHGSMADKP